MAQSLNSKVDLTIKATSFAGLSTNGNVMVGNKAFEFYNERNVEDCIQIPWDTIDRVEASVLFNKSISRFVIFINEKTYFTFSTKDNKKTLRAIREYVPADRMLRSLSFWDVVKRGLMYIPNKLLHSNN
mgnify:FL=1